MAEQKKNSPSNDNQRMFSQCVTAVSEIIRYVDNLDNEAPREGGTRKKDVKYLGCGAMGSCKPNNPDDSAGCSAIPKADVKKYEEPIADDKMLQSEDIEKWLNRENMKKLVGEMMRKYPQMVAVESEADKGKIGEDFDILCTECPSSFNNLELAQQHFEKNLHDKKSC